MTVKQRSALELRVIAAADLADSLTCATNTNRYAPARLTGALELLRDALDSIAEGLSGLGGGESTPAPALDAVKAKRAAKGGR